MALLKTLRLETVDGPVRFHVVPFVRLTLEVDVVSLRIAPVSADAFALRVTMLPAVASRRLLIPASATVLLKLIVETDGSAKIRSPDSLPMAKLSKVALCFVPPSH